MATLETTNISNQITITNDLAHHYEGLAKEHADSAKASADQAKQTLDTATSTIETAKNNAVNAISAQQTTSVNAVTSAQSTATTAITSAQSTATTAITTAQATAVNAVKTQQTTSVNAVVAQETTSKNAVQATQTSVINAVNSAGAVKVAEAGSYATVAREQALLAKKYAEQEHGQSDVTHSDIVDLEKNRLFPKYEIGDESKIYNELETQKRSTFDRSKFTVVGSPTITDDGVASGFSDTQSGQIHARRHVETINAIKFTENSKLEISLRFKNIDSYNYARMLWGNLSNFPVPYSTIGDNYFLGFAANETRLRLHTAGISSSHSNLYTENLEQYINKWVDVYCCLDNYTKTATIKYKSFDENSFKIVSSQFDDSFAGFEQVINFGSYLAGDRAFYNGEIDLKYCSITVDGVEVFNGNKTGIDQIKKDDYTVVGSPVINDYGILQASSLNYVTFTNVDLYSANTWKIKGSFIAADYEDGAIEVIFTKVSPAQFGVQFYKRTNAYVFQGSIDGSAWTWTKNITSSTYNFIEDKKYYYEVEFTGSSYNLNISTDGKNYTTISTYVTSDKIAAFDSNCVYAIGSSQTADRYWYKPIDLNDFKVYADGNLVYQPTLKIPYTQSKTGSKIVDSVYRDRVEDMYNQFGYTHYYTIGDGDYTLATHKNNDIIDSGNNYEQMADLTMKQWGSCTSGSVVNLLPYKDTNYAVTAPHSAKTESSFTASATGDYIAVGKVVL